MAQRVGRGITLLFHDRDTRRGWVVSVTPRPHFKPRKDQVPILHDAGWAPGPVWTGGKSRPHRDSIPDRPTRSQSLYRLSYPTHIYIYIYIYLFIYTHTLAYIFNVVSSNACVGPHTHYMSLIILWPIWGITLIRVCVCVCVCLYIYIYIYIYTYIHTYRVSDKVKELVYQQTHSVTNLRNRNVACVG